MTSTKYLDSLGVSYLWSKIKNYTAEHTYSRVTDGTNEVLADSNTRTIQITGSGAISAALTEDATSHNAKFTITGTSKSAASGGTDVSLVTTGEKATWNAKQNAITSSNKLSADLISDGTTNKAYTSTEKNKLAGIATGAEVNQNAFSNIKVGNTTIAADAKTDTLELVAGSKITLTPNTTNDKVTFDVDDTLIIEVGKNHTVPSGTYANITSALANNKIVIVKLSEETGITYFTLTSQGTSIYNFSFVAFTGTSENSSALLSSIGIKNDDTVVTNAGFLTDTKNTAGSTNSTSKLYIIGATSQAENPQTYSNKNAYVTSGKVYSNAKEVVNLSDTQALTNKTYNGYTLAAACAKGVDTSIAVGSNSTNIPTTAAVEARITAAIATAQAGAAMYQGTAPTSFAPTNYKAGYYWVVGTAGTYAGETCEPGDMIFANTTSATYNADHFDIVQSNLDISSLTNADIDAAIAAA